MKKQTVRNLILISLTAFIGNYLYFRSFGFYEDDYFYITPNIDNYLSDVISMIGIRVTNWFYGHPLSFITEILTYAGMKIGEIQGLYIVGFLILALNSILVYLILRKAYSGSDILAVSGAMMFCLFPANTAKIILTFSFSLQIAMTFLFISTLLYLSGKRKTSYITILGALFLYEPAFMVFWGVPLLITNRDGEFRKELLKHVIILMLILAVNLCVRYFMDGEKVLYVLKSPVRFLNESANSILDGPYSIILSFFRVPQFAVKTFSLSMLPVAAISFIIFIFSFYGSNKVKTGSETDADNELKQKTKSSFDLMKLLLASLILIILSYCLPLVYKTADVTTGKMTIVHTAASFGGSVLFASVFMFVINLSARRRVRILLNGVAAAYLTLLVCYGITVQKDFVQSWENQRTFWTSVKKLSPDITDGTLIFVIQDKDNRLPETKFIQSNSWTDPIILRQIYDFPDYWSAPPRLFVFNEDWKKRFFVNNDSLEWNVPVATWDPHTEVLADSGLIILKTTNDRRLVREEAPVTIGEKTLMLRAADTPPDRVLKEGSIHSYIIKPE